MTNRGVGTAFLALIGLLLGWLALPAFADSQARIVRLSSVEGTVEMDRGANQGRERAIANTPIVEGTRLWTGQDGKVEVEFEDGSTLRLTPNSILEFSQLSLRDSGGKVSTVEIQRGTAYFHISDSKRDEFTVHFARQRLMLDRSARFRVGVTDSEARVAVSKGEVTVQGPDGSLNLSKNHTAFFDLRDQGRYEIARNYQSDPYDDWDKEQDEYHSRYGGGDSYDDGSPYRYGFSDLNYYGSYTSVPGYGRLWRPYFAGYGWDPFFNGAWVWYPGWGYTWVSAYPWGWIPFRYGNWVFVNGSGWCWQPGYWNRWNALPPVRNAPPTWIAPRPPANQGGGIVIVERGPHSGPITPSGGPGPRRTLRANQDDDGRFEAGLGIPRGRVNLRDMKPSQLGGPDFQPGPKVLKTDGGLDRGEGRNAGSMQAAPGKVAVTPGTPGNGGNRPHESEGPRMAPSPRHATPAPAPPAPRVSSPAPHPHMAEPSHNMGSHESAPAPHSHPSRSTPPK